MSESGGPDSVRRRYRRHRALSRHDARPRDREPISADAEPATYAELAAQTGMTEGNLHMTVKRLRERYGELLREEISATVSSPEEVDEEVRYLKSVLAKP